MMQANSKKPDAADIHIGRRVQERRRQLGLSQERLGEQLGITFQQVQKYEKGANRIGAGRLFSISAILQTQVGFFYQGLEQRPAAHGGMSEGDGQSPLADAPSLDREAADLLVEFERILDPVVRRSVLDLIRSLASSAEEVGARRPTKR